MISLNININNNSECIVNMYDQVRERKLVGNGINAKNALHIYFYFS